MKDSAWLIFQYICCMFLNPCISFYSSNPILTEILSDRPSIVHATNQDGDSCIHIATFDGNINLLKILLKHGANPNVRSPNRMRMNPIGLAAMFGRYIAMEILLENGADVNDDFDVEITVGGASQNTIKSVTALEAIDMILEDLETKDATTYSVAILEKILQQIEGEQEAGETRFEKSKEVLLKYGAKRRTQSIGNDEL